MSTFGKVISDARKKLRVSQKELAARIKKEDGSQISPQYLNDIEHDRRNPPSESLIEQFARELELSKDYLCLAAGSLPQADLKRLGGLEPDVVEDAYRVFRRKIRGGQ